MPQLESNLQTYEDYRDALRDIISGTQVGEKVSAPFVKKPAISERLVQCIWFDGHIKTDALQTVSGKTIEIIQPGRWNEEAGPDFISAEIKIAGEHKKGDVEIHVHSSDWLRHKHERNFEYNHCVLHAFLFLDDDTKTDFLFNGTSLERLHLKPYVFPDLETIQATLSADDYAYREDAGVGKCAPIFRRLEPDFLGRFLDLAGDRRIEEKAARLRAQLPGESYDQVFYQALMTAMGYKGSKTLFFLLSKRAPVEELLDYTGTRPADERAVIIQAILFNVANLIPARGDKSPAFDAETIAYLDSLNRWWMELSGYFTDRILPPIRKWFAQVRPANFATRRIAGIARLIARLAVGGGILDGFATIFRKSAEADLSGRPLRTFLKEVEGILTVPEDTYWSSRFNFTSKKSKRALTLIGANRARSVLFNALLPMLLLKTRAETDRALEKFIWRCVAIFPSLPDNVVTKFMRRRLFGDDSTAKPIIFNERRQQALFKIFYDCCNNNEVSCDDCYFYRRAAQQLSE